MAGMVLPIAFGAAVAASAAVLKAKCTLVAAGEGCGEQRKKARDPWVPQVSGFQAHLFLVPVTCPFSPSK